MTLVVKNLSATLEKMQPCHSLRFARGAIHNLKSHSTKSGRYLSSHFQLANTTPADDGKFNSMRLSLSVTQNSQDHRASFRLVQGRPGCGCCVATERATPTITISAKVVLKMQLKCSPERECNYTNRLMGHY